MRVDKEPSFRMGAIPSTDHTALFLRNDDESFVKAATGIATGQRLLVRFSPFAGGQVVLSFPIEGGSAVMAKIKQAGCQLTGNAHAVRALSPRDSTAPVNTDQPYFEFQVEKQVQQIPGTGNLQYPDMLRSANVEGEVLAQFVVDAEGRYEAGSFKVLKSTHELFTQAVTNALPNMRFYPAEVGGKKVPQLVQQPFTFSLTKGN